MPLPTYLPLGAFVKATDTLPTWFKFTAILLLAFLLLLGVAIYRLPDILREAPPTIRALREQPLPQSLPYGATIKSGETTYKLEKVAR
jgi:hypothetical protein